MNTTSTLRWLFHTAMAACLLFFYSWHIHAEEAPNEPETIDLGGVTVQAERLKDNIELIPGEIIINLEDYKKAGVPHSILDILSDRAIIDFRGDTAMTPTNDDIQMRGFESREFTTALDGLAIQKLGGHWGGHFVDYSIIPMEQIESIEILPGPHSALYEGKSLGGAINIITKAPKRREQPEVDFKLTTSYASLNTMDNSLTVSGGAGAMDYILGIKDYHTDGYLKNTDYDLSTVSARMAWILPSDGYISLLGSYTDKARGIASENDPNGNFYDSDYPVVRRSDVSGRWRDPALDATRNKYPRSIRLNWKQPSRFGDWTLGSYYTYENQRFQTEKGLLASTQWSSFGAKIQNDFYLMDKHLISVGFDTAKLGRNTSDDVVRTYAWFVQDNWQITPRLSFRPGLRYEQIAIWWNNSHVSGSGYAIPSITKDEIEKNYNQIMPKAFATYQLDGLRPFFRDTSVSLGVSSIWTPRAECEVCTWGSGVEMDPTEGYAIDLIIQRRLWKSIKVMVDVSHYAFDNYVISASSQTDYYQNSPWGRRKIGLEDVYKNGIEIEINGDITDKLSMNISAAYVDWRYDGPEGGIEEMSASRLKGNARYRINSGVTYDYTDRLQFHLDYKHQDREMHEVIDVIDEEAGLYDIREVYIDSYGVMDFSVAYQLPDKWHITNPRVKAFVNNLLEKEYVNTSGYLAPDRTYGVSLSLAF